MSFSLRAFHCGELNKPRDEDCHGFRNSSSAENWLHFTLGMNTSCETRNSSSVRIRNVLTMMISEMCSMSERYISNVKVRAIKRTRSVKFVILEMILMMFSEAFSRNYKLEMDCVSRSDLDPSSENFNG